NAIYCFVCNSFEKSICGDDFRTTSSDANSRTWCEGSCIKRRGERVDGSVRRIEIVRSCVTRQPESCYNENYNSLNVYTCSCNSDFCNLSSRVSSSRCFAIFVGVSVLALIRFYVLI
ncbi:unnamed protein product, partial [Candidula unifasciata]